MKGKPFQGLFDTKTDSEFTPLDTSQLPRVTLKEGVLGWKSRELLTKLKDSNPRLSPVIKADEYTIER